MNNREIKIAIDDMKREVSNVRYFLQNVKPIPTDRKSVKNLENAKASLAKVERFLGREISDVENRLSEEIAKEKHEKMKKSLASINSPSGKMQKTAEQFLSITKTPNQIMKTSILEQIKKASRDNAKQKEGSVGNGQHRQIR